MVHLNFVLSTALLASLAAAWNPSNSYAPTNIQCPSNANFLTAASDGLSKDEADWVKARHNVTNPKLIEFLKRMNLSNFDAESFLANSSLNIGLAFSGGGYRAMLSGAGQLAALDERTVNSTKDGHLGGLLQASTYLAGLSGGNWLVNSIVLNNFTSVQALQGDKDIWDLSDSIFNPGGINIFSTASYYDDLVSDIDDKKKAGFEVSLTDIWGRSLSQQFIGLDNGGPALELSDVRNYNAFTSHAMPFPIVVSVGRAPGSKVLSTNSTVFEFTPFHLGSWDPSIYHFTDIKYLGSNVSNGVPVNKSSCVTGFDNGGFIFGTSSSLFNQFLLQLNSTGVSGVLYKLANSILENIDEDDNDIAVYAPNPFKNAPVNSSISMADALDLVDGGEDNQNVPLYPLQQQARNVDVIFAYDNSADTDHSWPNGNSIGATYNRQFGTQGNHSIFPAVPDNNTIVNLGLNTRPVFFGCYASNFTTLRKEVDASQNDIPPLIVWNSNYPYSYASNTSTFKMSYKTSEVAGMIENGYNVATRGNSTDDSDWGVCVGCAIIQRERERRGLPPTDQCRNCFDRYCWDGTLNSTKPAGEYNPKVKFSTSGSSSTSEKSAGSALTVSTALTVALSFAVLMV
ncbi:hypothetical protein D0Z00_001165 [Geotrichum galactomycetum]|uniref:Uncharacterized protein n=1 Tax=Geotrichum galactomycetum TaxID=27317 RepID=A0ACB6V7R1_9ASCO|nr:hypothetical protein D0Z00_001165 [Geotrichum candidum]